MLSIKKYDKKLVQTDKGVIIVITSKEDMICPRCSHKLGRHGYRNRTCVHTDKNGNSYKQTYRIQRTKCTNCKRIHHVLPDIFVPYKRLCQEIVERCLDSENNSDLLPSSCEMSTIYRIRKWFKIAAPALHAVMISRLSRYNLLGNPRYAPTVDELRLQPNWLKTLVWYGANFSTWFNHYRVTKQYEII
jgi:transposase